ncbi:MAG: hypothetical protein CME71_11345 [Halobacteriovorax sp.]|nr:hypothetical protein [Halobacteriovorax sp.]
MSSDSKVLRVLGVDIAGVFDETPKGRERLVLETIAECMGRKIELELAPYGRHLSYFGISDKFDLVATVPPGGKVSGFQSKSHIDYQNVVTTLKDFTGVISSVSDLKGLDVVSFKGARSMLAGLEDAIPTFKTYQEIAQQDLHTRMLMFKRVDAVISDKYIFFSHTKRLQRLEPDRKQLFRETKTHEVFEPSKFTVSLKNQKLRDSFNRCLELRRQEIAKINDDFIVPL